MPLSKKTLLLYVLVYIQQFGAENFSVENAIFVTAFRIIFEKSGGAIAPASPMAARCLKKPCKAGRNISYTIYVYITTINWLYLLCTPVALGCSITVRYQHTLSHTFVENPVGSLLF